MIFWCLLPEVEAGLPNGSSVLEPSGPGKMGQKQIRSQCLVANRAPGGIYISLDFCLLFYEPLEYKVVI